MTVTRFLCTIFWFCVVAPLFAATPARQYRDDLERLALWCEEEGLTVEAAETRAAVFPESDHYVSIPIFPLEAGTSEPDIPETEIDLGSSSGTREDWQRRFYELRRSHGEKMFVAARAAAADKRGGDAIELVIAALQADPDHLAARTLLGYRLHEGAWRTAWEIEQLRKGQVEHPVFGWIPQKQVADYEKGLRYWNPPGNRRGEWIDTREEDRRLSDFRNARVLASEHYRLRTNLSHVEAVTTLRRLEDLYRAWQLLFFRYMETDEQLAERFRKLEPGKPGGRRDSLGLAVHVYRTREQYVEQLKRLDPHSAITSGMYIPRLRQCHFFPPDPTTMDEFESRHIACTLLHEATHQLFQESRGRNSKAPGTVDNYWLLEGVALYMESLRREGDYYVLGEDGIPAEKHTASGTVLSGTMDRAGIPLNRLYAAKFRYNENGFFVPFSIMVSLGQEQFQWFPGYPVPGDISEERANIYSQAAGAAHFLMHAEGGRFRSAMIDCLRLLYEGRTTPATLAQLTGERYETLDEMYREYLRKDWPR